MQNAMQRGPKELNMALTWVALGANLSQRRQALSRMAEFWRIPLAVLNAQFEVVRQGILDAGIRLPLTDLLWRTRQSIMKQKIELIRNSPEVRGRKKLSVNQTARLLGVKGDILRRWCALLNLFEIDEYGYISLQSIYKFLKSNNNIVLPTQCWEEEKNGKAEKSIRLEEDRSHSPAGVLGAIKSAI